MLTLILYFIFPVPGLDTVVGWLECSSGLSLPGLGGAFKGRSNSNAYG